jgi:predicted dehydrogenase
MLVHPIYLARHFLGGNIVPVDVQVTKLGAIPWMKSDELCATFKSGQKMGRVYASFNSSRDAIFLNIYGRDAILKLDLINSELTVLPRRVTSRFSKGFDSIRQAGQLTKSAIKNGAVITSGKWLSGHQKYISLFADCYLNHADPPITVEDASEVIRTLQQMCRSIQEHQERTLIEHDNSI